MTRRRKAILSSLAFIVLVEVFSCLYFETHRNDDGYFKFPQRRLSEREIANYRRIYHPLLGWETSVRSFRNGEKKDSPIRAAVFGAGVTYLPPQEFGVAEWIHRKTHWLVDDYSVRYYGMDQMLLRAERELPLTKYDYVFFVFSRLDIELMTSVYPRFHVLGHAEMIKPRFYAMNGRVNRMPNLMTGAARIDELRGESFLKHIAKNDRWYNASGLLDPGFPYLTLWSRFFAKPTVYDFWNDFESRAIFFWAIDRLNEVAKQNGVRAVFAWSPVFVDQRIAPPDTTSFTPEWEFSEYCKKKAYVCWEGVSRLPELREHLGGNPYFQVGLKSTAWEIVSKELIEKVNHLPVASSMPVWSGR